MFPDIEIFGDIEQGIAMAFKRGLYSCMHVRTFQNHFDSMFQVHGDAERAFGFLVVRAKLFQAETGENEDSMDTRSKSRLDIGYAIADKDCITHIQAQFITGFQQHPGTRFTAIAIRILRVWAIVYFLYYTAHCGDLSNHLVVNMLNRFY